MSKGRLLITGANGFVGSHLVRIALQNNYEIIAAVRKSSNLDLLKDLKVTYIYPDYFNQKNLVDLLKENGVTHIAHVAGSTRAKSQDAYNKANVEISVNLANAALQANPDLKKFVFISSLAATGASVNGEMITEETAPNPLTFYGKSKRLAEQELTKIPSLPLIALRPTAVYGEGDKDFLMMIRMIKKGWEAYIGKASQTLSFIYADDLCNAVIQSLESEKSGEAYILSDGNNYTRYAFADIVKKILHKKTLKMQVPLKLVATIAELLEKTNAKTSILNKDKLQELTANWQCSIAKAKQDLGYSPQYNLETGLQKTIAWLLNHKEL